MRLLSDRAQLALFYFIVVLFIKQRRARIFIRKLHYFSKANCYLILKFEESDLFLNVY